MNSFTHDELPCLTAVQAVPNNTAAHTTLWGYDPSGRVVQEQVRGITSSFLLDGGGRRFRRVTVTGRTVYTVYGFSGEPLMVLERVGGGALTWKQSSVFGFGTLISEEKPSGTFWVQGDQVGSPNIITNAEGAVVGRSKNLPFGERFGTTGETSARRYTNHEDQEGSAIYMQARMYLPAYGKFAQVDPAYDQTKDDPESWNLYNYVTNNPVTHTDPDGRQASVVKVTGVDGSISYRWASSYEQSVIDSTGYYNSLEQNLPGGDGWGKSGKTPETQSEFLTKDTLLACKFNDQQATALAAAQITAGDLVAATLAHEFFQQANKGDSSAVQAGVIAVMNRVDGMLNGSVREGEFRANKGVTQDGLSATSQMMLKVISAPEQFHSLISSDPSKHNRGAISSMLLGKTVDAGFSAAKSKLSSYFDSSISKTGFRQIWDSPTHLKYDIGGRMSFHRNMGSKSSEPGGIVIWPNVFY